MDKKKKKSKLQISESIKYKENTTLNHKVIKFTNLCPQWFCALRGFMQKEKCSTHPGLRETMVTSWSKTLSEW